MCLLLSALSSYKGQIGTDIVYVAKSSEFIDILGLFCLEGFHFMVYSILSGSYILSASFPESSLNPE